MAPPNSVCFGARLGAEYGEHESICNHLVGVCVLVWRCKINKVTATLATRAAVAIFIHRLGLLL